MATAFPFSTLEFNGKRTTVADTAATDYLIAYPSLTASQTVNGAANKVINVA